MRKGFIYFGIAVGSLAMVNSASAQDTIILMSGRDLVCRVLEINQLGVKFQREKRKKIIEDYLEPPEVFSIHYKDGAKAILYRPGINEENTFSVEEMEMYITGTRDAFKYYKAPVALYSGVVVGMSSGLFLPAFWSPVIPAVYSFGYGLTEPSLHKKFTSDTLLLANTHYMAGYRSTTKKIRTQNVIKGSIIGVISGILIKEAILRLAKNN